MITTEQIILAYKEDRLPDWITVKFVQMSLTYDDKIQITPHHPAERFNPALGLGEEEAITLEKYVSEVHGTVYAGYGNKTKTLIIGITSEEQAAMFE